MKKVYTTLAVLLIGSTAIFAQKQSTNLGRVDFDQFDLGSRTPTDTLWPGDFANGTPTIYGSNNGGYVIGNNGYGDLAKGQVFISNATVVEGAAFWFAAKNDGGNGSNVIAEVRTLDGTAGTTSVGSGQTCPGTVVGTANIAIADVDTSGMFNFVSFTPGYVGGDFYVGFDVSGLAAGDTVGLVSSTDGDAGMAELSWEKWGDGSWYSVQAAWDLDFDLAIWAIVDNSSNGIESDSYFNGIKADVMPNPATTNANLVFELQNPASVDVMIVDLSGKVVFSVDKGEMAAGRHQINIPVNEMAAGTYLYSIGANGARLSKKMIVNK